MSLDISEDELIIIWNNRNKNLSTFINLHIIAERYSCTFEKVSSSLIRILSDKIDSINTFTL